MKASHTFWNTLRDAPAGLELPGAQLLARAGLVRSPAAAVWTFLPLGQLALENVLAHTAAIAQVAGANAFSLPWGWPAESRGDGNRWRAGDDPTWAAWDLAERELRSYRVLPRMLYAVVPRRHPAGNPRAGLLGSAGTRQLAVFSFGADLDAVRGTDAALRQGYLAWMAAAGVPAIAAGAADGSAWLWEHPEGNTAYFHCDACAYAALPDAVAMPAPPADAAPMLEREEVETPDCTTIAGLADFLGVDKAATMKVVFFTTEDDGKVVCAVIRGDLNIDEAKLSRALGGRPFRAATDAEVRWVGSVPGYGSPIGLRNVAVLADQSVAAARNLVAGANREPFHVRNVNAGRDFKVDRVLDLRAAAAGDPCPACGGTLVAGHAFALGGDAAWSADAAGHPEATYLDEAGRSHPVALGRVTLDLDMLIGAFAEANRDGDGLIWPANLAPAQVHLVAIKRADPAVSAAADQLYERLLAGGHTVFFDDRDERAGVAFKDADLIGLPLRLTVSQRALEAGGIEAKWRHESDRSVVAFDALDDVLSLLS